MRLSYADVFHHNTSHQGHGYIFPSMVGVLKMESKTFCRGDVTRLLSREIYFAPKLLVKYGGYSRASAWSSEYRWQIFTSLILLQAFYIFQISSINDRCRASCSFEFGELHSQRFWLRHLYSFLNFDDGDGEICDIETD